MPQYLITNVIPKQKNEFIVYRRNIDNLDYEVLKVNLKRPSSKNIPKLLELFLRKKIYPFGVYDYDLNFIRHLSTEEYKKFASEYSISLDIEAYNKYRYPDPKTDPITCIGFGNIDYGKVIFVGKSDDFFDIKTGYKIKFYETEREALEKFEDELYDSKPIFLITHNGFNYDYPYLQKRGEKNKINLNIDTLSPLSLFNRGKIRTYDGFLNVDLIYPTDMLFPKRDLGFCAKFFDLEMSKMSIDELWISYENKEYGRIIEHNVGDVRTTQLLFLKLYPYIYYLAQKLIGPLDYAFSSNLVKSMYIRNVLDYYTRKRKRVNEIVEIIDENWKKINNFRRKKITYKVERKAKRHIKLDRAYLIDLSIEAAKKISQLSVPYKYVLLNLLNDHEKYYKYPYLSKIIRELIDDCVREIEKKKIWKEKIENIREDLSKKYTYYMYKSRRYLILPSNRKYDKPLDELKNLVFFENSFITNWRSIPIYSVPKRKIDIELAEPKDFYNAFIDDIVFTIVLEKRKDLEIKKIKEQIKNETIPPSKLRIEVKGYNPKQLSGKTKRHHFVDKVSKEIGIKLKKGDTINVIKTPEGFVKSEDYYSGNYQYDKNYYLKIINKYIDIINIVTHPKLFESF
jgi:DNA polymerase elongation subunit (family B)